MKYRITGSIGEMQVDLVVEAPKVERKPSTVKVGKLTDDEIVDLIGGCRAELGPELAGAAEQMVHMLAQQNKAGSVAVSRAYREVWYPLAVALGSGKYDAADLLDGMQLALSKGIPNINYAKKAATPEARAATPVPQPSRYREVTA